MAKKSKAEKAAEKKAEQEQLEAERLERERIEAERLEKERIEREHQERVRKEKERVRKEEEAVRLAEQEAGDLPLGRDRGFLLQQEYRKDSDAKVWKAFLECGDLPAAAKEAEINTYTVLCDKSEETSLEEAATAWERSAELCKNLRSLISTSEERGEFDKTPRLREQIAVLRRLTLKKIDAISAYICQHAEKDTDGNMKVQTKAANIEYGMWVNLARQPRTKEIEYPDINIKLEIPRPLALANIAVRVLHFSYDERAESGAASTYMALGGPFAIELLALPPAPKPVGQWTIRQVTALSTDVLRLPYPIPPAGGDGMTYTPGSVAPVSEAMIASAPPVRVTVAEPAGVLFRGNLVVGWWDDVDSKWKQEGITEIEHNAEAGNISFKTVRITTLAFLQPRGFDFPFSKWSLSLVSENAALFSLSTPSRDISIEVGEGVCRLVSPDDSQLQHLIGQPLETLEFLNALAKAGFNLIPNDGDLEDKELVAKDKQFEDCVYAELARAAAKVSLKSSKWNRHNEFLALDDEGNYTPSTRHGTVRAVVQMCPSATAAAAAEAGGSGEESPWRCLLFTPQRDSAVVSPFAEEPPLDDDGDKVLVATASEGEAAAAEGESPEEVGAAEPVAEPAAEPVPEPAVASEPAATVELMTGESGDAMQGEDTAVKEGEDDHVKSPLDMLPTDRIKVCTLLSTTEDDDYFTEESLDDEGDVKERFHTSVKYLLGADEEAVETIVRSAPLFTEAVRHLLRTLRVLSSTAA